MNQLSGVKVTNLTVYSWNIQKLKKRISFYLRFKSLFKYFDLVTKASVFFTW